MSQCGLAPLHSLYVWGTTAYLAFVGCFGIVSLFGGRATGLVSSPRRGCCSQIGLAGACFSAMQSTLSYLNALPEYRSRVLGVLTLCIGTGPIGFLHVGWLAETFGAPVALIVTASEGSARVAGAAVGGAEVRCGWFAHVARAAVFPWRDPMSRPSANRPDGAASGLPAAFSVRRGKGVPTEST